MIYHVTIAADSRVITKVLDLHGYLVDREASIAHAEAAPPTRSTYFYTSAADSSSEVIDRVFGELEAVGAAPAGLRVSVRPLEGFKP